MFFAARAFPTKRSVFVVIGLFRWNDSGRAMRKGDRLPPRGRGAGFNPPNRFESSHHDPDLEQVEDDADYLAALGRPVTEFLPDRSRSLICKDDSPDVGFEMSLNPYRGCEHGCIYC